MLRGLYTATAGMMTQQRRHDTVTQNIANMNTPGYKQEYSVQRAFPEVLISMMGGHSDNPNRTIGRLNTGVFAEESLTPYVEGIVTASGQNTDFALEANLEVLDPTTNQPIAFDSTGKYVNADGDVSYKPQAFFTVLDANNELRYTRGGQFNVTPDGQLVTSTGYRVADTNGEAIELTGSTADFKVNSRGEVLGADGQPTEVALGISVIDRPYQLVREGNGNFRLDDRDGAVARYLGEGDNVQLKQGFVESSNVDSTQSMIDMMAAARAYEANQRVIQFYDKSLEKAVNDVGRV